MRNECVNSGFSFRNLKRIFHFTNSVEWIESDRSGSVLSVTGCRILSDLKFVVHKYCCWRIECTICMIKLVGNEKPCQTNGLKLVLVLLLSLSLSLSLFVLFVPYIIIAGFVNNIKFKLPHHAHIFWRDSIQNKSTRFLLIAHATTILKMQMWWTQRNKIKSNGRAEKFQNENWNMNIWNIKRMNTKFTFIWREIGAVCWFGGYHGEKTDNNFSFFIFKWIL